MKLVIVIKFISIHINIIGEMNENNNYLNKILLLSLVSAVVISQFLTFIFCEFLIFKISSIYLVSLFLFCRLQQKNLCTFKNALSLM